MISDAVVRHAVEAHGIVVELRHHTDALGAKMIRFLPDYLRNQAAMYRQLAEQTDDPVVKNELPELASVEVANNIEDHLPGG